jgi:hypothetical protein
MTRKHYPGLHDQRTHGNWARGLTQLQQQQLLEAADELGIEPEEALERARSEGIVPTIPMTEEEWDAFRKRKVEMAAVSTAQWDERIEGMTAEEQRRFVEEFLPERMFGDEIPQHVRDEYEKAKQKVIEAAKDNRTEDLKAAVAEANEAIANVDAAYREAFGPDVNPTGAGPTGLHRSVNNAVSNAYTRNIAKATQVIGDKSRVALHEAGMKYWKEYYGDVPEGSTENDLAASMLNATEHNFANMMQYASSEHMRGVMEHATQEQKELIAWRYGSYTLTEMAGMPKGLGATQFNEMQKNSRHWFATASMATGDIKAAAE